MALVASDARGGGFGKVTLSVIKQMNEKIKCEVHALANKSAGEALSEFQQRILKTVGNRVDVARKIQISTDTIQWTDNGRSKQQTWLAEHMVDLEQVLKHAATGERQTTGRIDIGGVHADANALAVPLEMFTATFMDANGAEMRVPVGSKEYCIATAQLLTHEEFSGGKHDNAVAHTSDTVALFKKRCREIYQKLEAFFSANSGRLSVATYFSVMFAVLDDQNYQMAFKKYSYGSSSISTTTLDGIPTQINVVTPEREEQVQGAVEWRPGPDGVYKQTALGFKISKSGVKFAQEDDEAKASGEATVRAALDTQGLNLRIEPTKKKFKASYVGLISMPFRTSDPTRGRAKGVTRGVTRGGGMRGGESLKPEVEIPPVTVCKCELDYENPLHDVGPMRNFNCDEMTLERGIVATYSLVLNVEAKEEWTEDEIDQCTEEWWTQIFQGLECMWSDFAQAAAGEVPAPILEQEALLYNRDDEESRSAMQNRISSIHKIFAPGKVNFTPDDV